MAGSDDRGHQAGVEKIYRRMGRALHRGTGLRLSADDVRELVEVDDAVARAMANACGRPEAPGDVQSDGPLPTSEARRATQEYFADD